MPNLEYPYSEMPPLTSEQCEQRYKELLSRSEKNQYLIKLYHIKHWVLAEIRLRELELDSISSPTTFTTRS